MSSSDLKYTAGLFDGRGSILLHKTSYQKWYVPKVRLVLTKRRWNLLEFLQETFGGCVSNADSDRKYWILQNKKAIKFLADIRPYVKTTRRQKQIDMILAEYASVRLTCVSTKSEKRARIEFQKRFKAL